MFIYVAIVYSFNAISTIGQRLKLQKYIHMYILLSVCIYIHTNIETFTIAESHDWRDIDFLNCTLLKYNFMDSTRIHRAQLYESP